MAHVEEVQCSLNDAGDPVIPEPHLSSPITGVASPTPQPVPGTERVYRHRLPVRIGHWLNVVCLFISIGATGRIATTRCSRSAP